MAEARLSDFKNLFREKQTWHVKDIEKRLGISRQSVYRLRDQLYSKEKISLDSTMRDDDGTLLRHEKLKLGFFKWPDAMPLEEDISFALERAELEALKTAVAQMKHLTPLLESALSKLSDKKMVQKQIRAKAIIYNPQTDFYEKDFFEQVSKAILNRRVAEITYMNAKGETNTYRFNSYILIPSDQHLHLVGVSHNSIGAGFGTIVRLRLDQIKKFALKDERFPKPDFDVVEYATREFGPFSGDGKAVTIRVQFSPEKARYIQRTKRHKTQDVKIQKNGNAVWSINAPISDDLVYWIVSYGPHAKVLQPKELRTRVLEWAKGAIDTNS